MSEDSRTSAAAAKAAARCLRALEMFKSRGGAPRREVERARGLAPDCLAAHGLRLALIVRADARDARKPILESVAAIEAQCADPADPARTHAAAASAWAEGDARLALVLYARLAAADPADIAAHAAAEALRRRLERPAKTRRPSPLVFHDWSAATPGYGSLLAMYALALSLDGQRRRAEWTARRALMHEPGRRTALLVLGDGPETSPAPPQAAGRSAIAFGALARRNRPAKADAPRSAA